MARRLAQAAHTPRLNDGQPELVGVKVTGSEGIKA